MEKYLTGKFAILNILILVIATIMSLVALPFSLPILSHKNLHSYAEKNAKLINPPFYRWEDGKIHDQSQVFSDMTGWNELTALVSVAYNQLNKEEQKKCTIYGERNYGYAGAIHFYGKQYKLPEAITFLESYTIWAPDSIAKGPIIYINKEINGFKDFFENITETGTVRDTYFREYDLKVFLCIGPKSDLQEKYKIKAQIEKNIYRRQ